jgi:hypothetical protein
MGEEAFAPVAAGPAVTLSKLLSVGVPGAAMVPGYCQSDAKTAAEQGRHLQRDRFAQ